MKLGIVEGKDVIIGKPKRNERQSPSLSGSPILL